MDHIRDTFSHFFTLLSSIEEDGLMELSIPNVAQHTAKQTEAVEVLL